MNQELKGNEKIEEAILMIQQEPSMDTLSFAILSINRRMREGGKLILSVESAAPAGTAPYSCARNRWRRMVGRFYLLRGTE